MREFMIENGIVIDDMDSVIDGIRNISGKEISDAETIRKFITQEKATKYYIDKKCTAKMQADRDTVYLWLDSGYVDRNGDSIMISLLNDNYGGYTGHYFGTMDMLANAIKNYFPKNARDISRNLGNLKNKYQNKIAQRAHCHIDNEQEYLIMLCNNEVSSSEFERLVNNLNVQFDEPELGSDPAIVNDNTRELTEEPAMNMSFREKEITVGLLLDTIDNMQKYINDLNEEVVVNPETDLVCVCANCHRMIHKNKAGVLTVDELKNQMRSQ